MKTRIQLLFHLITFLENDIIDEYSLSIINVLGNITVCPDIMDKILDCVLSQWGENENCEGSIFFENGIIYEITIEEIFQDRELYFEIINVEKIK